MARKIIFNWIDGLHGEEVTIYANGLRKSVNGDHPKFNEILKACEEDDFETLNELLDKALAIKKFSDGLFEVVNGVVHIDGQPAENSLSVKIIKFMDRNLNYRPLVEFWRRLQKNPSYRSREQLFRFLEVNKVPIVDDVVDDVDYTGCFVVWKSVSSDFKDHHSGTFDNTPGNVVRMERKDVNDNPNETCSSGLHVASWDYAGNFKTHNAKFVKCYVDPEHVVSVPIEHGDRKMRVCEYYVVEEVDGHQATQQENNLVMGNGNTDPEWDDDCPEWAEDYDEESEDFDSEI